VFEHQAGVGNLLGHPARVDAPLKIPCLLVGEVNAKTDDCQVTHASRVVDPFVVKT
jgi:hypothetical protein